MVDHVSGRLTGIFTAPADGSRVDRITQGPDTVESWSPDGRSILFTRARPKLDPNNRLGTDVRVVSVDEMWPLSRTLRTHRYQPGNPGSARC